MRYLIFDGLLSGHVFDGTPVVISGESRVRDNGTSGRSYPAIHCEKIDYATMQSYATTIDDLIDENAKIQKDLIAGNVTTKDIYGIGRKSHALAILQKRAQQLIETRVKYPDANCLRLARNGHSTYTV